MKLFVIVLCLISEYFLVHGVSYHRFDWFVAYCDTMQQRLSNFSSPWIILTGTLLPLMLIAWLAFYLFENLLFGFGGLLLNVIIFYYCLGPENPFFPVHVVSDESGHQEVSHYFAKVNGQLFAVIFWYIVSGPLAVLAYRLISLCQNQPLVSAQATWLTGILDWVPARITSLLYLLAGNFQAGFREFYTLFFEAPQSNHMLLSGCGLQAVRSNESDPTLMPIAENLVEHAVLILLVLLALFTLVAWI